MFRRCGTMERMSRSARRRTRPLLALAAAVLVATACTPAATTPASPAASGTPAASQASGELIVFAAASLKESFTTLAKDFETAHPGVKVTLNFGPSSGLATQITNGAPVDVFASAAQKQADDLVAAGLATESKPFAKNALTIALAPKNPAGIVAPADLAKDGTKVAVCAPEVPCGTLTTKWQQASGITLKPVTQEVDVKGVLTKVTAGEADAGLVYRSDAKAAAAQGVTELQLPDAPVTPYPIVVLKKAPQPKLAADFVALVTGDRGQAVLSEAGFQ